MQAFGIIILLCGIVAYMVYRKIKKFPLQSLKIAYQQKDYEHVNDILQGDFTKRMLNAETLDRWYLRLYFMSGKQEEFLATVKQVTTATYTEELKLDILEAWYHKFLFYGERGFGDALLEAIDVIGNEKISHRSHYAYAVLLDHEIQLLKPLQDDIDQCREAGFGLGLFHYLKAELYVAMEEQRNALKAYDNAIFCMGDTGYPYYLQKAQDYIDRYGDESILHYKNASNTPLHKQEATYEQPWYFQPKSMMKKQKK